jgi:hypothetical protein
MKAKIIGILIHLIYRIYSWTFRYSIEFASQSDKDLYFKCLAKKPPLSDNLLFAFYHQHEYAMIPYFSGKNISVMVSQSRDGEAQDMILRMFGYNTIRGSSHRRAVGAFIECLKSVRAGYNLTLAVDGPRGPIYKVKEGVIKLQEKSGKLIIPMSAEVDRYFMLHKAWNKGIIPKAFAKVKIKVGRANFYEQESLEQVLLAMNFTVKT